MDSVDDLVEASLIGYFQIYGGRLADLDASSALRGMQHLKHRSARNRSSSAILIIIGEVADAES
jgi:hypothetical protein